MQHTKCKLDVNFFIAGTPAAALLSQRARCACSCSSRCLALAVALVAGSGSEHIDSSIGAQLPHSTGYIRLGSFLGSPAWRRRSRLLPKVCSGSHRQKKKIMVSQGITCAESIHPEYVLCSTAGNHPRPRGRMPVGHYPRPRGTTP